MEKMKMVWQKISKRSRRGGFTLLETILAAGILVFALCSIAATFITCYTLDETSKNINIATNAAESLMEQIRCDSFAQIVGDYSGLVFAVNAIPLSKGVVYVDDTNPELLIVTISVCWKQGASRVIGEDTNLNGVLDAGEDKNGNGIIDSPVELITMITTR